MTFYDDANRMTKEAVDNTMRSMSIMTKGFQQIAGETTEFAKRSFEHRNAAIGKMAQSTSIEKTLELQNEYARSAFQRWVGQAARVGEIYSDIARQACEPFEKIAADARDLSTRAVDEAAHNAGKVSEMTRKKAA